MHLKKISTMALIVFMGISIMPTMSFAASSNDIEVQEGLEILKDKINKEKEAEYEKELEGIDKNSVVVIPEDEKERAKLIVKDVEIDDEEASNTWAALKKPEFDTIATTRSRIVIGTATPGTNVRINIIQDGVTLSLDMEADSTGMFGFYTPVGYLLEGTVIQAYEYEGKKKSEVAEMVVIKGDANSPLVGGVTNYSDYVIGYSDGLHDKAFVEINGKTYTCGSVGNDGDFAIEIPRQKVGTKIKVYTVDEYGDKSPVTNILVEKGFGITGLPKVLSNTQTIIKGKTKPFATVMLISSEVDTYAEANAQGDFTMYLNEKLKAGKNGVFLAQDNNSEILSEEVVIPVHTTPKTPKITTKRVTVDTTKIKGTAGKGCTIYVKIGDKSYKSKTNSNGEFSVTIPKQKKNTEIKVYSKSSNGVNSSKVTLLVATSSKAPVEPTIKDVITNKTTTVKGTGAKGLTAYVKIGDKKYKTTVASDGTFSIKIPQQSKGTILKVYLKNKNGENSPVVKKKVYSSPKKPSNISYEESFGWFDGTLYPEIWGNSSNNNIVYVKIGDKTYKSDIVTDGEFCIDVPKLKKGTKVKVYSKHVETKAKSPVAEYTVK